MSDKDKDAKTSSIAKTLNKVEDRLEKGVELQFRCRRACECCQGQRVAQFRVDTSAQSVIAIPS
mgnify:FL=1